LRQTWLTIHLVILCAEPFIDSGVREGSGQRTGIVLRQSHDILQ